MQGMTWTDFLFYWNFQLYSSSCDLYDINTHAKELPIGSITIVVLN